MKETITKKMFQIGDIAVLANQSGENFLYDNIEKKLIGDNDVTYTNSSVRKGDYTRGRIGKVHTGMILQTTEDGKKCRIYDAYNKKLIVDNWELVAASKDYSSDLIALLINPETGKYHVFNSGFMGIEGYDIFDTPFDNARMLDSEDVASLALTLNGKEAYYYAHSSGLVTGFDYDNIEQIMEDDIIVTLNGKDKQFVLDGNMQNMSQIYENIRVSNNVKHSTRTVNYFLYCDKDDYTDVYRANWRGINTKFRSKRYDNMKYVATMEIDADKKDVPTKLVYYFFGEKDGETYLLKGTSVGKEEPNKAIPIKEVAHIKILEPLGKNACIMHADNGKQGLIISYNDIDTVFDRRDDSELFEPDYDYVHRFGKNYVFGLQKGKKTDIYSANIYYQSKGGYMDKDLEILSVKGNKVVYKKNKSYGIGRIEHSNFHGRSGYTNVRELGGGFYEYTEDGKKGVYDTINNVCDEIHYVGPKNNGDRYSKQIFVVKSDGEYEWLEFDPCCPPDPRYSDIEVKKDKAYLKADKLEFCGEMVNASTNNKSTLYTLYGSVIKSYDKPVSVSIQEEVDEKLYVVENGDEKDYFELKDDKFKPVEIIDISAKPTQGIQRKKSLSRKPQQKKDE